MRPPNLLYYLLPHEWQVFSLSVFLFAEIFGQLQIQKKNLNLLRTSGCTLSLPSPAKKKAPHKNNCKPRHLFYHMLLRQTRAISLMDKLLVLKLLLLLQNNLSETSCRQDFFSYRSEEHTS